MHRLSRLGPELGLDLWIKRDDLTGFCLGGNKGRKLEYLIAAALDSGADTVVGSGASQSNFVRQLAGACAVFGLRCVAVTMDRPYETADRLTPGVVFGGGNRVLDGVLGLDRTVVPDGTWEELEAAATDVSEQLRRGGRRVYQIPLGGSGPLGVEAFFQAGMEARGQGVEFDAVVTASSSGSTHVGLATAFLDSGTRVVGVACDPEPEIVADLAALSREYVSATGRGRALLEEEIEFELGYVGPGYGAPSVEGDFATETLARREGILLDPVYTAKAFAGLMGLAREGRISGRVLFWHTGGTPALFATGVEPL